MLAIRAKYEDYEVFVDTLRALKSSKFRDYEAYGPVELAELEDLMPRRGSPVRIWATVGALSGLSSFWMMCVLSSLIYSLVTGGKPPISNVPFVIIGYEGTILLGAISACIGVFVSAKLRSRKPPLAYDPSFSSECFGIIVQCNVEERANINNLLKESGATEINEFE